MNKIFGKFNDKEVILTSLKDEDTSVSIMNWGAAIQNWKVGDTQNPVVLGFENFEIISYEPLEIKIDNHTYFEKDLYTKELNTKSSELAQQIEIRAIVDNILKFVESSADSGLVVEGRDMGSVVFPDATLKIYLDADEHIRSSRRVEQSNNEETTDDIAERDKRDLSRKNSPLVVPKGALMLQNNTSTVEELVDEVIENLKLQ